MYETVYTTILSLQANGVAPDVARTIGKMHKEHLREEARRRQFAHTMRHLRSLCRDRKRHYDDKEYDYPTRRRITRYLPGQRVRPVEWLWEFHGEEYI